MTDLQKLLGAIDQHDPARTAIRAGGATWTYGQLARARGEVAERLCDYGVQPGDVVAVEADRSLAYAASILGVLSVGGVVMPFPVDASDRDLRARTALGPRLMLDRDGRVNILADQGRRAPAAAFVFFTSGSTGDPAAVPVPAAGIANYLRAYADRVELSDRDVVAGLSSLLFDGSIEETLAVLLAGGQLVLDGLTGSLDSVAQLWADRGVTVAGMTTALFTTLMSRVARGGRLPGSLRQVVIGGEAYSSAAVATWLAHRPPGARLLNTYGPTECSVVVCWAELGESAVGDSVIGEPVPGVGLHVLQDDHRAAADGEIGTLWVSGVAVAPGYLPAGVPGRERFHRLPLGSERTHVLCYDTGDLVTRDAAGVHRFVARRDELIKLNGFRVEPREVETAVLRHDGVRDCRVLAVGETTARRLVAFVIPDTGTPVDVPALRAAIAVELPPYLRPAEYAVLDAFPLTGNGKIDQRALVSLAEPHRRAQVVPAQDRALDLLSEILGRPVSGDRDFFGQGGTSLAAVLWVTRIEAELGRTVDLLDVLTADSLSQALNV